MRACSIVGCSSKMRNKPPDLSLHQLPFNEERRKAWLDVIGVENIDMTKRRIFVCSLHFEESCFNRTLDKLRLKDDAVPSKILLELVQEASETLLPKLKEIKKIKNSIDNETYFEKLPSPVQFSIQVDVESCVYDDDSHNHEADVEEINVDELDKLLPTQEVIISNDKILDETEQLSSSPSYADRRLQVEVHNYAGKITIPHIPDKYEDMLQAVLLEWKAWYTQSKFRGVILAYKCIICSVGWWNLAPFEQHIRIHKDVKLSIDTCTHECCIIATQGEWYETMCLCQIEGNCPQCLRSYDHHIKQRLSNKMYYECKGCNEKFSQCGPLFAHEGECIRNLKIIFKNAILTESMWKCDICNILCITEERYNEHYLLNHLVRSDYPAYMPFMKACVHCSNRYHLYALHACPSKLDNIKCDYCPRKFHNRTFQEIHMKFTKKDYYCKICKRYLKSQCMEAEHLLKHSRNFLLAFKCNDCQDNVLLATESGLKKHKMKYHFRKLDRRRDINTIIVPRSCMSLAWAEGVTVEDMIINKAQKKEKAENTKSTLVVVANAPNDIVKNRKDNQLSEIDKQRIEKMCADLKDKLIKRACANASTSKDDELFKAIEALRNDDLDENSIPSIDERIKEEIVDDHFDIDDDIKETQDSVNALLMSRNVGNGGMKDDVKIEEPNWDMIVIDDSDGAISEDESQRTQINKKDDSNQNIDLSIVKQEPSIDHHAEDNNVTTENVRITTEVIIKEETQDNIEEQNNEDDIKNEHDACLEELSKVFRASKEAGRLELTGISLAEEVHIKNEPMDEEYEEDIIMLCNDETKFELTSNTETDKNVNEKTSEMSKDLNSDMDLSQFEPDLNIKTEPSKSDDDELNLESVIPTSLINRSNPRSVLKQVNKKSIKSKKKLYRCKKCQFLGTHRNYQEHKSTICLRKRHKTPRATQPQPGPWSNVTCTKCDASFENLKLYANHFTKHGLKLHQCPRCHKYYVQSSHMIYHLTSHIKHSFQKLQLLKETSYFTSKNTGIFQCKVCQEKVAFDNFFVHWEKHLNQNELDKPQPVLHDIEETSSSSEVEVDVEDTDDGKLVMDEEDDADEIPKKLVQIRLTPEQLKKALDQMQSPMGKGCNPDKTKRCQVCKRQFGRRNDVKRHLVEHLLRDAQSRVPALVCQLCQFTTNKPDAYKMHMRNHAALPVFKCEICTKWFSDSSNFAKHRKVHNINILSKCELCKRKFNSKRMLEKHMEMHRKTKPINCDQCDRTFFTESSYKKHYRSRHDKPGLSRYCRICLTKFYTMRSMWTHMWEVHQERRTKADCPICGEQFRKQQDVREHLRDVHHVLKMRKQALRAQLSDTQPHKAADGAQDGAAADDIESFLQRHNEIEIGDDGEETLVIYEMEGDEDDDDD